MGIFSLSACLGSGAECIEQGSRVAGAASHCWFAPRFHEVKKMFLEPPWLAGYSALPT